MPVLADYIRDLRPAKWGSGLFARQQSLAAYVRFGSKADIALGLRHVRFTPKSGHQLSALGCQLCATCGPNSCIRKSRPIPMRSFMAFCSTKEVGPTVSTSHQAALRPRSPITVTVWQTALEDVGLLSVDKGAGGKSVVTVTGVGSSHSVQSLLRGIVESSCRACRRHRAGIWPC
jgi:hypothetical protein